ncbi:MAG: ATP-binding cassette domain-containing protein [Victivallales bacterium]|nr:ATP-binding cassette domain-containing protein [Victivallales bacterium]
MNLVLKNISKTFFQADEKITLYSGLDLTIPSGAARVIMGPSGCGKTTLLRIIDGLETPDTGAVLFDAFSLYECDENTRRNFRCRNIGFADQSAVMLPQLTVLENVLLPTLGTKKDLTEQGRSLLTELGLEKRIDFFPHQLSGGERQRAAWARALILTPQLLLLDEPTSALEPLRSHALLAAIRDLNRTRSITIIIATHNPMTLEYFPEVVRLDTETVR